MAGEDDVNDTVRGALENAVDQVMPDPTPEINAPEDWPEEGKTYFSSIQDPKARQWFVDQSTNQSKSLKEISSRYEGLDKVFEPYDERIKSSNDTYSKVVERLLQAQNILETKPVEGLKRLVEMFKIDPKALAEAFGVQAKPDDSVDPPEDPLGDLSPGLKSWLEGLKTSVEKMSQFHQQAETSAQQEIRNNLVNTAKSFRETKDETGNLLYPHMAEKRVTDKMSEFIKAGIVQVGADVGAAYKNAYEQAVYFFPDLREKQNVSVDQDRVNRAKRAGASVRGAGGTPRITPSVGKSVREQLQAAYDARQENQQ